MPRKPNPVVTITELPPSHEPKKKGRKPKNPEPPIFQIVHAPTLIKFD